MDDLKWADAQYIHSIDTAPSGLQSDQVTWFYKT